MTATKIKTVFVSAGMLMLLHLHGQDGHYWTQQYGTRSMLLNGSVIGGVDDLGAVYYNPARLGQIENPVFLISADVYEVTNITVSDAFGEDKNAARRDIKGVPSLAAGTYKIPWLKKHSFAWAILVRNNSDLNFSYGNEVYDDVIENFPGDEYLGAQMAITAKGNEQWTGLSWAYPLTERLSIGASGYLSLYTQNKGLKIDLQALSDSKQAAIYRYNRSMTMEQYSLLGKFGLSYSADRFLAGLTFLSPSLFLKGSGSYQYEKLFSGIEGYSQSEDVYTTNSQSNLKSRYKSSMAIGAGFTYFVGKSKLHLSSEWFNDMPKYTLYEAADHYSQSNGDTISFKLTDQLRAVVNVGFGIEYYINEKISGYLSASTDYSPVTKDISRFAQNKSEVSNNTFSANYFHYGGGIVLRLQGADITLGANYMGAKQDFARPINFPDDGGMIF